MGRGVRVCIGVLCDLFSDILSRGMKWSGEVELPQVGRDVRVGTAVLCD